jgi:hypothetical protein
MNRAWRSFLERGAAAGRAGRGLAPEDSERVARALAQFVDHGIPLEVALGLPTDARRRLVLEHRIAALQVLAALGGGRGAGDDPR